MINIVCIQNIFFKTIVYYLWSWRNIYQQCIDIFWWTVLEKGRNVLWHYSDSSTFCSDIGDVLQSLNTVDSFIIVHVGSNFVGLSQTCIFVNIFQILFFFWQSLHIFSRKICYSLNKNFVVSLYPRNQWKLVPNEYQLIHSCSCTLLYILCHIKFKSKNEEVSVVSLIFSSWGFTNETQSETLDC